MLAVWLSLLLPQVTHGETQVLETFAGEYRHTGGSADERELERAIDRVVSEMSWFARGIARRRLRAANRIPRTLRIATTGDRVRIAFDGRERETVLRGDPVSVVGFKGAELEYRLELSGRALVQRFHGEKGGRFNELRREEDALVVRVTVFSPRLPERLVYDLRYARSPE